MPRRCDWVSDDPLYIQYHDEEWGVPEHDDRRLFEMLLLEGAQAGLSWITILRKRENYRTAFAGFDPARVARFAAAKVERLLQDPGIVRNRAKVEAAVVNARCFLKIAREEGSFSEFAWQFVDGQPLVQRWRSLQEMPAKTPVSTAMSKELRRRGFKFVGPTICYSFMQAVGMVNDHMKGCCKARK
jgi:DNA-3-methyladenine glycosylase I